MSAPDINTVRDRLLVETVRRKATNQFPLDVLDVCEEIWPNTNWEDEAALARSAAWLLLEAKPKLAKKPHDRNRPHVFLLAQTAAGKSEVARLENEASNPTKTPWNWTKIGVVVTVVIGLLTIAIMKDWL